MPKNLRWVVIWVIPALALLIIESLIVDTFVAPVSASAKNECLALADYAKLNLKDSVSPIIGEGQSSNMILKFRLDCHEAFALKKVMEKSQAPCAMQGNRI